MSQFYIIDKKTGATVWSGKCVDRAHAMRMATKALGVEVTNKTHLVRVNTPGTRFA